jgi:hypothetical protein
LHDNADSKKAGEKNDQESGEAKDNGEEDRCKAQGT